MKQTNYDFIAVDFMPVNIIRPKGLQTFNNKNYFTFLVDVVVEVLLFLLTKAQRFLGNFDLFFV